MDADQHCPIVRHYRHAHLHHRAFKTFVANFAGASCQQRCDVTFDHRTAIPTGTGQVHLMRGPDPVEVRCVEDVQDFCGARLRVDRLHRRGDAHAENAAVVQRLAQLRVIDSQIPPQGVDLKAELFSPIKSMS